MKVDDNDKLWDLLGKTRQPAVSPFFARNVLRAVRQEQTQGHGAQEAPSHRTFFSFLRHWTWQLAIVGTCAVAALITISPGTFVRHHHRAAANTSFARQIVGNPDYEVIKHLDELVADEESSLWLDDSVN